MIVCEEERKAYHEARRAQAKTQAKAEPKKQLTKAKGVEELHEIRI